MILIVCRYAQWRAERTEYDNLVNDLLKRGVLICCELDDVFGPDSLHMLGSPSNFAPYSQKGLFSARYGPAATELLVHTFHTHCLVQPHVSPIPVDEIAQLDKLITLTLDECNISSFELQQFLAMPSLQKLHIDLADNQWRDGTLGMICEEVERQPNPPQVTVVVTPLYDTDGERQALEHQIAALSGSLNVVIYPRPRQSPSNNY